MEVDLILKKKGCKQDLIRLGSSSRSKVVFALLIEVVVLYIGLSTKDVRGSAFEKLVSSCFLWYLGLKNSLNNLL